VLEAKKLESWHREGQDLLNDFGCAQGCGSLHDAPHPFTCCLNHTTEMDTSWKQDLCMYGYSANKSGMDGIPDEERCGVASSTFHFVNSPPLSSPSFRNIL